MKALLAAGLLCWAGTAAALSPKPIRDGQPALPWSVELGGGAVFCGARGDISCDSAGTGTDFELRVGKRIVTGLELGLGVTHASLPVEGFDSGSMWIAGPELAGVLTVDDAIDLTAGLRVAAHHVAGVFGSGWGVGTVDLRLGGRYLFGGAYTAEAGRRWTAGLDYALTRPARTESCQDDLCADVDLALLHRLSVVVGLRFW